MKPLRQPRPGTAMVLVPHEGAPVTIRHGEPVPDARHGRYRYKLLVDVSEHRLVLDVTLLSRDPNFGFRAQVSLNCWVGDPAEVVARGIRDVSGSLYDPIRRMLRDTSRAYDVREFHAAENALNALMTGFAGDNALRLRNVRVELLVDEDEVTTSGRAFRDLERETRLEKMRRHRHLQMMRDEGVEGLLAGIVEREGPRAALEWIAKAEATERAELSAMLDTVLKHTGADLEPWMIDDAVRPLIDRVTARPGTFFGGSRVRGALTSSTGAEASGADSGDSGVTVGSPHEPAAALEPLAPAESIRSASPDGPPADEPPGGHATAERSGRTADDGAGRGVPGKRTSRVRGTRA
ncbi:hypothetical protein [Amycolatopsis sp. NPDC059021]|uniref:hypothetical protein n=1 Tax=Amycolatopsis sp. NPDC059021 TaxID=3346704 RepID=UPI0036728001